MISMEGTNLGVTVKKLRETKGMSRIELSETVGISESHLKKIEAGNRQPGIQTYRKNSSTGGGYCHKGYDRKHKGGLHSKGAEGISGKYRVAGNVFGAGSGVYGTNHEIHQVKKRIRCCGSARNDLF